MQLPIEPDEQQLTAILAAVHDDRIDRFLPAAAGSRDDAFRLYLWNCTLCEAFYLPMHFAEIAVRNAIHNHLINRFTVNWFDNRALIGNLDPKRQDEFKELLDSKRQRHGDQMTCHHLVSELSSGFGSICSQSDLAALYGHLAFDALSPIFPMRWTGSRYMIELRLSESGAIELPITSPFLIAARPPNSKRSHNLSIGFATM